MSDATEKPSRKGIGGRPSLYSDEIVTAICVRLMAGESLKSITSDDDMPSQATVYNWLLDKPEFVEKYERARALQADTLADETLDIADDGRNDWMLSRNDDGAEIYRVNGEHIQRSRLRIDQRKWYASKIAPKKYGDKVQTEISGPDGGTIKTEDVTNPRDVAQRMAFLLAKAAAEQG